MFLVLWAGCLFKTAPPPATGIGIEKSASAARRVVPHKC